MGRSQKASEASFDAVRQRLPFRVRELHPDNDSALLNDLLWKYCRKRRIAMSRSRPYENWTHVRKVVGYRRFDRQQEQEVMRELYRALADFQNFFQPVMKLKEKVREGGKVRRVYDEPKTPCQRVLGLATLTLERRKSLQARYETLNPAALSRRIQALRGRLFDLVESKDQGELRPARRRGPGIELTRGAQPAPAGSDGRLKKSIRIAGQKKRPAIFALLYPRPPLGSFTKECNQAKRALRAACSHSEGPADSSEPVRRIGLGSPLGRDSSRIRPRVQRREKAARVRLLSYVTQQPPFRSPG